MFDVQCTTWVTSHLLLTLNNASLTFIDTARECVGKSHALYSRTILRSPSIRIGDVKVWNIICDEIHHLQTSFV